MTSLLLSVLLPARDSQATLGETLESLARQTRPDFEVIAVDDGSRDDTAAILEAWASRDRRFKAVRGPARGISAALNAGLRHCRGAFIARMDADDIARPTRFERQLAELEAHPELAAVGSQVEIFPRERMTPGLLGYESWLNSLTSPEAIARECFVESPLVHPAATIRASALADVGGWRDEGWPEDYALWLEMLSRGFAVSNVAEVLFRWRDRPDRLTRTHPDYEPAAHLRLKARYLARMRLPQGSCIVWGAGKTGRALRRALQAENVEVEQFVDIDPAKIGRPLHGIPVVSPDGLGSYSGTPLVAAVGAKGARALIREHLSKKGWVETEQFTCVG
ncbi:MAG TPA: glycosyltransferase [Myxococcales bacterium]|jgi:glycosyltransferase involved in cell wall biosynthesis